MLCKVDFHPLGELHDRKEFHPRRLPDFLYRALGFASLDGSLELREDALASPLYVTPKPEELTID